MHGKLITFEGIDGSGKSTQMRLLAGDLRMRGLDVITTMQPGGTPLGRRLREAFLETEEQVHPMAELLLFAADRAQHVNFLIKPALKEGKIVISDRYADATFAYQGAGRGFSKEVIDQVISLATDGLKPDLTIFFDLPIENAISRTTSRSEDETRQNRMDREDSEFYERVRGAYLATAEREPDRFRVVEATGSISEIHQKVAGIIGDFFNEAKIGSSVNPIS